MPAKILLLDIETAPGLGWAWEKWETNILEFVRPWYILCFGYKWLGDEEVHVRSLPAYSGYKSNKEDDKKLSQELRDILDKADIVVAHNGDAFDLKKANARFLYHGILPPSGYRSIDTLKVARKHFKFDSNKLNDLGQLLGVGEKQPTIGFKLWKGCMAGDDESWLQMERYNAQDVRLLEQIYLRLRPWIPNHPDLNLYSGSIGCCPSCGSDRIQRRGISHLRTRSYQRLNCQGCGHWFEGKYLKKELR